MYQLPDQRNSKIICNNCARVVERFKVGRNVYVGCGSNLVSVDVIVSVPSNGKILKLVENNIKSILSSYSVSLQL